MGIEGGCGSVTTSWLQGIALDIASGHMSCCAAPACGTSCGASRMLWQAEMQGDITTQRRWEAYDKLGTFVIYVMSFVLGIQALGLEGEHCPRHPGAGAGG